MVSNIVIHDHDHPDHDHHDHDDWSPGWQQLPGGWSEAAPQRQTEPRVKDRGEAGTDEAQTQQRYPSLCPQVKYNISRLGRNPWFDLPILGCEPSHQKSTGIRTTRRYSPQRVLTSSSCGGLRPLTEAFFALWAKKDLFLLFFFFWF